MDVARYHAIKDRTLRPWTVNDPLDALIKEECYELDETAKRLAPFKKGGGYGLSTLDRKPAELIEIEKLLLNLDGYPVARRSSSPKNMSDKRHSAGKSYRKELGESPPDDENTQGQLNEHSRIMESSIRQTSDDHKTKNHGVKRFEVVSETVSKTSIYGTTRRKVSMSAICKPRKRTGVMNTSTENFNRFLQRQVKINKLLING